MAVALVTQAWKYTMASGVPASLVAQGLLGQDGPLINGQTAWPDGWVFAGSIEGDPYRAVEGTQRCAVVLYSYDSWAPSDMWHTIKFPRLNVAIYADPTRTAPDQPHRNDADAKAQRVFEALDRLFHDAANVVHDFAGMPVVSTLQGSGFSLQDIPKGDGAVRGLVTYNICLP